MVTRRDQLAIKRAPPSGRSGKGRGKGRGRGRGKKPESGSVARKAAPKAKAKAKSKSKSSSSGSKKKLVCKHDVEDEEVSEAHPAEEVEQVTTRKRGRSKGKSDADSGKAPKEPTETKEPKAKNAKKKASKADKADKADDEEETTKPKRRKGSKNTEGAEADTAVPTETKKRRKSSQAARPPLPSSEHEFLGDSRVHMVNFIKKMDLGVERDEFKENVRMNSGDMGKASLNIYWTRYSCGLRWRTGRAVKDIAHFSFSSKTIPGSCEMKGLVAISCAVELVTCRDYYKSFS